MYDYKLSWEDFLALPGDVHATMVSAAKARRKTK